MACTPAPSERAAHADEGHSTSRINFLLFSAMNILVTGGAGFIGSHLCELLVRKGNNVIALDNFDPFHASEVKRQNLAALAGNPRFRLIETDVRDLHRMQKVLHPEAARIDVVVHLAARTGVRPSLQEPVLYSQANVDGTQAMLELARWLGAKRFIFGSSSSVYGNNPKVPFAEADPVDHPISPYAATKRAGELLCHTYHHLYGLSVVCLRFFTVYGPRQRPDQAIHKFARLMTEGRPIELYGDGSTARDYTFVSDIVQGIDAAIRYAGRAERVHDIINLGAGRTTTLRGLVDLLSETLGIAPVVKYLPPQAEDGERTCADVSKSRHLLNYAPDTGIEEGISRFVEWFLRSRDWSREPAPRLRFARTIEGPGVPV